MTDRNENERTDDLTADIQTENSHEEIAENTLLDPDTEKNAEEITEEITEADIAEDTEEKITEDTIQENTEGENAENTKEAPQEPTPPLKAVFEWVEMFAMYFAIAISIVMIFVRHCPVNGESMMHTLNHKDVLLLYTFCYTPENGDMIVCQSETYGLDRPLVKRVIATEGQKVKIDYKNWTVTVDGVTLNEDYIWKREGRDMLVSDYLPEEFTVPEGHVFVMGDNRNNSKDSRSSEIGFIDERYVVGKVWIRIAPNFTVFD